MILSFVKSQNLVIGLLNVIIAQGKVLMASEQQILDSLASATVRSEALGAKIEKIAVESTATLASLTQTRADLQALINSASGTSVAVDNALAALSASLDAAMASAQRADDVIADPVVAVAVIDPNAPA